MAPVAHGAPTLKTETINQWVDTCFRTCPNGLVTNVQKGAVPSQYQSLVPLRGQRRGESADLPSSALIAMMASGARIITAPTKRSG